MKTTPALQDQLYQRIKDQAGNWAFTPRDFLDLAPTGQVGVALSRLLKAKRIRRIARGLYDCPHQHPLLGQVGAGPSDIVDAIARSRNLRILPSPAVAANMLGLSTQVPASLVYQTDGSPTEFQIGNLRLVFRRNSGRLLALAGTISGLVVQALKAFGKAGVTRDHIRRLQTSLSDDQKRQLLNDLNQVPAWMRPHFHAIAEMRAAA